jgi:hypothetical protein
MISFIKSIYYKIVREIKYRKTLKALRKEDPFTYK